MEQHRGLRSLRIAVIGTTLFSFMLVGCAASSAGQVSAAHTIFKGFVASDPGISNQVSWGELHVVGKNIGLVFNALAEDQRNDFKASFLTSFGKSFGDSGATFDSMKNWRLTGTDKTNVVVSADTPSGGRLNIVLKQSGPSFVLTEIGLAAP
ncbi:MAG: hypothetical protein WCG80_19690 [Spirochaetales bacterium]